MLQTNSTLDQPLNDSASNVNTSNLIRGNSNQPPINKQGGKKFQLKAVDVGNIYKSLKMGQQSGTQTAKNSNLPPTHNVKLNSGVRNSSQANRTMIGPDSSTSNPKTYQSQVKSELSNNQISAQNHASGIPGAASSSHSRTRV